METTLHRQLKAHYSGTGGATEVRLGAFRIDIVREGQLIEIQHSSLGALRSKVSALLDQKHRVEIIKPIVARKWLRNLDEPDGQLISQRWSPKRGTALDVFHDLVFFSTVFPHRNLTLRVPLIEIEEVRYPFRRRNRRRKQCRVQDQSLLSIGEEHVYRTRKDLCRRLPESLPSEFGTAELARELGISRWFAQRIAYCLRKTGAAKTAGKQGNQWIYRLPSGTRRDRTKRAG